MKYLNLGSRLRLFRERAGLSQAQLAKESDLSEEEVRAIESNEAAPKIAQLIRFAKILKVNVADIFRERLQSKAYEILRQSDREKVSPLLDPKKSRVHDYSYEMLTLPGEDKHMDAYLIEIPPHQGKKPHEDLKHPGEEFIYLLKGQLKGQIAGEDIEIHEGDSVYFHSSTPHSFYNPYESKAIAISVIYPF